MSILKVYLKGVYQRFTIYQDNCIAASCINKLRLANHQYLKEAFKIVAIATRMLMNLNQTCYVH